VAEDGRPPDGDGAGAEKEEISFVRFVRRWTIGAKSGGLDSTAKQVRAGTQVQRSVATCNHIKMELSERTESVMPKMKTKSGAKKRFRVRPGGTVKRGQAFKRHILTKKTTKSKRQLRGSTGVHETNMVSVTRMMPFA
jgi:large subunit ribosomal protein L35